jgi:hypothetical protein
MKVIASPRLLRPDTCLRFLPASINRRQAVFIDGVRHSAETIDFAYGRLRNTLTRIALGDFTHPEFNDLVTSGFLDAWAIVDAIDRFRMLWATMPGERTSLPPGVRPVSEITQPVRKLRNVSDHLAQRVDQVVGSNSTALGVISWFTGTSLESISGFRCALLPGTLQETKVQLSNPSSEELEWPTGAIFMEAGGHRVSLSETIALLCGKVASLEAGLLTGLGSSYSRSEATPAGLLVRGPYEFPKK